MTVENGKNRLNKLYIGTNTKMYQTASQTVDFITRLKMLTCDLTPEQLYLFILPSFTALPAAVAAAEGSIIQIGAQNMFWENEGPFTGEISPAMLKDIGVEFVMAGHSERRLLMGETDEDEAKRIAGALEHDFTALLCIGETKDEMDAGQSDAVLRRQLKLGLRFAAPCKAGRLLIAYEPVWAIGAKGIAANRHYADERHLAIKELLAELLGPEIGFDLPVLYGGSVNSDNAGPLIQMPHIDGLFIGRSAWEADGFNRIIRSVIPCFHERQRTEAFKTEPCERRPML